MFIVKNMQICCIIDNLWVVINCWINDLMMPYIAWMHTNISDYPKPLNCTINYKHHKTHMYKT